MGQSGMAKGTTRWMAVAAMVASLCLPAGRAASDIVLNAPAAEKKLRHELETASLLLQAQREEVTSPQDLFAAAREDYARFYSVLYANGFYAPVIRIRLDGKEAADFSPVETPRRIDRVAISIDPGPRFTFGKARMRPYAPGTELPHAYRDAEPARSTAITDAAKAGVEGWKRLGYAKASVTGQDITADHRTHRVDADILLGAGPRLRFGRLSIIGNEHMRDKPIRKISGYPEGEYYSPEALKKMTTRLYQTGVFSSIIVREADSISPGNRLDIDLTLAEEPLHRLGFGAEYSSLDGGNLSAFWMHRNLFGGAEQLRFDLLAKGIGGDGDTTDYQFGVRLERPGTPFTDSSAFVFGTYEREEVLTTTTDTLKLGVGAIRVMNPVLTIEAGLNYEDTLLKAPGLRREYHLVALPLTFRWDRRDDQLLPTKGSYVELSAEPFMGWDQTDSGYRLFADTRYYRPLMGGDRLVFAARFQAGTIESKNLLGTPPDYLFFSGGAGTVRGQSYQSLGSTVVTAAGQKVYLGGRSFVGLSGELRAAINERVGAAAFYDVGYVSRDSWFSGRSDWQAGAGVGIRYDTGVGPVRLDLAVPAGGTGSKGLQIYVGIGQAF